MTLEQIKTLTSKEWRGKGNEKLKKKDLAKFREILESENSRLNILNGATITPKEGKQFTVWNDPKKMKNGGKKLGVIKKGEEAEIIEVAKVNGQFRFKIAFGEDGQKQGWIYPQLGDGTPIFEIVEQEEVEPEVRVVPRVDTLKKDEIIINSEKFDILSPKGEKLPDSIKIVKRQGGNEIRAYVGQENPTQLEKEIQPDGTIIFKDKVKKYFYNPNQNTITKIEDIVPINAEEKTDREVIGDDRALTFLKSITGDIKNVEDINGKEFEFEGMKFKGSVQNKGQENKIFFEETNTKLGIAFIIANGSPIILKGSVITSPSTTHEGLKDAFVIGRTADHLKSFIAFSKKLSYLPTEKKHEINNFLMFGVEIQGKKYPLSEEQVIKFIADYNSENEEAILGSFSGNTDLIKVLKVWLKIPVIHSEKILLIGNISHDIIATLDEKIVLVKNSKNEFSVFDVSTNSKQSITITPIFGESEEATIHSFVINGKTYQLLREKKEFISSGTSLFFTEINKSGDVFELKSIDGKTYTYDGKTLKEKIEEKKEIGKLTLKEDSIVEVGETTDKIFVRKTITNLPLPYIIGTSDEGKTFQLFSNTLGEGIKKVGGTFSDESEIQIGEEAYIFNSKEWIITKKIQPETSSSILPNYSYDEKAKTISDPKDGVYQVLDISGLPGNIKIGKQGNSFIAVKITNGNKVEKISISSGFSININDEFIIDTKKIIAFKIEKKLEDTTIILSSLKDSKKLSLLLGDGKILSLVSFDAAKSGIEEATGLSLEKGEGTLKRMLIFATKIEDARIFLFPLDSFSNPIEISTEKDGNLKIINEKLKDGKKFICLKTKQGKYILGDLTTFNIIEGTNKYDSVSQLGDAYLLLSNGSEKSIFDIQSGRLIKKGDSSIIGDSVNINGEIFEIGNPIKRFKLNKESFVLEEIITVEEKTVFRMGEVVIKQKGGKYMMEDYEIESESVGDSFVKIYSKDKKTFTIYKKESTGLLSRTEYMEIETSKKDFIIYKNSPLLVEKHMVDGFEFISFIEKGIANILLRDGSNFKLGEVDIINDSQMTFKNSKGEITIKFSVSGENILINKV